MIKQLSLRLSILAGVLAAGAGGTAAQATDCSGTLAPGSYTNINVPAGATCTQSAGSVAVSGNVTVGANASLAVTSTAHFVVSGSLIGMNAFTIQVTPAAGGIANILSGVSLTGTLGFVSIQNSFIGGTLSVSGSNPVDIFVISDSVGGTVLIRNNTTRGGPNSNVIAGNVIGGSLVCSGNTPAPVNGGTANTVGGAAAGQCAGL